MLFMYIVQPFFDWLLAKPKRRTLNIITLAVLTIVLTDFILTKSLNYTPKLA
jgi:hypothetical protein